MNDSGLQRRGLPILVEHWSDDGEDDDMDSWMSASNLGGLELHGFNGSPYPLSVSVVSQGEDEGDFDDLISTGSLLSTVHRLRAMLHRAENTKLELCRQLAGTEVLKNTSMNTMISDESASVISCTDNDSTPSRTPSVNTETQFNTNVRTKKSGIWFFRTGDEDKKKKIKFKRDVKKKLAKASASRNTFSNNDYDDDDDLQKIKSEQRLIISKLQTSLKEHKTRVKELNAENNKLSETNARIELQYMNKMHEMQRDFELRLKRRDEKVSYLTYELNALRFGGKQETI